MSKPRFVPLAGYLEFPVDEMKRRAAEFRAAVLRRRTVRQFSDRPIPREIIEDCLRAAGSAPSGANLQPWHFVAVSDPRVTKSGSRPSSPWAPTSTSRSWRPLRI